MAIQDVGRVELEARAREIMRPEFVDRVVYPAVGGTARRALPSDYDAAVVQNTGTGRVTIRYHFGPDLVVYGKLYSDELGPHCFRVMTRLWEDGFGADERYQVVEPLAYLPEHNMLLTRAADGVPLLTLVGQDSPEVLAHVRQAATWLVRLHRLPARLGPPDSLWYSLKLFRLVRRLTKAVAMAPQERTRLTDMLEALCDKGKQGLCQPLVQTHGRFHHEHVFVAGPKTTVLDFDRSHPADPAKDLGEFVSMLRLRTFKRTGSVAPAEASTRAFLDAYRTHLPWNLENLAIHWAAFLLLNMFHYVKKPAPDASARERMMQFYRRDLELALSGTWVSG